MNQERWRRVDQLYQEALARPDGAREAFLREACGDDDDVRQEVESLLGQPEGTTWTAPVVPARHVDVPALVGRRLGLYQDQASGHSEIWTASAAGDDEPRRRFVLQGVEPPAMER